MKTWSRSDSTLEQVLFTKAIVRPPSSNFADGLTTVNLGRPDYQRALAQHEAYCQALERCGLKVLRLAADERYPDATFVEDAAVLTGHGAVLTRPGAASRTGEVSAIGAALADFFPETKSILEPGTVDGGDICEFGSHFFIGLSARTNEAGAGQLAELLSSLGFSSSFVDIRGVLDILHLKSGIASLGKGHLVVIEALCDRPEFKNVEMLRVPQGDEYAANCVQVNDHVLIAAGFPRTQQMIQALGYHTIAIEMSEFEKMDGGLSCLSLRF